MIQNVLRAIGGIENYGIISVCLFFLVFLFVMVFAFMQKKPFCETMSALPLDDETTTRSAGLQPAVSPICNRQRGESREDVNLSNVPQDAILRYSRLQTCATATAPGEIVSAKEVRDEK